MVDFIQHDIIQMAYFILQPSFVYGPKLFQQDHGILFDSIDSGINLNMRGKLCLVHFGCDRRTDHYGTVSVSHIVLNDQHRSDSSLFAPHHRPEIRIKNIPSFNYHTIHTPFYFNFFTPENKYFQLFSCVYMCGVLLFNQNTLILRIPLRP